MNKTLAFTSVAFLVAISGVIWAQDEAQPKTDVRSTPDAATAEELAAIRETDTSFKKAFDAGDAKAVAAHWTSDGEFVDESGRRLQGRDEIEKEYAAFFASNPGVRITSRIDQLRLVNSETAVEDGTGFVEPAPAGAPGTSRYTVVHVKQDGEWLMWSVRETRIDTPSHHGQLEDFEQLIGTWVAENQGVEFEVTCRWIANKNFIEQSFKSQQAGRTIASGKQIIGWDPANERITSWTFSSDGGHALGTWTPHETGWFVDSTGTLIDGTPTSAVNIISKLDDNAVVWRSVNRTAGAFRVLDTDEVVLKRKPAEKG